MASQIDLDEFAERMAPLTRLGMDAKTITMGFLRSGYLDEFVAQLANMMGGVRGQQDLGLADVPTHAERQDMAAAEAEEPNGLG